VLLNSPFFWDIVPRHMVICARRFGTASWSDTSVTYHPVMRHSILEERTTKSNTVKFISAHS